MSRGIREWRQNLGRVKRPIGRKNEQKSFCCEILCRRGEQSRSAKDHDILSLAHAFQAVGIHLYSRRMQDRLHKWSSFDSPRRFFKRRKMVFHFTHLPDHPKTDRSAYSKYQGEDQCGIGSPAINAVDFSFPKPFNLSWP